MRKEKKRKALPQGKKKEIPLLKEGEREPIRWMFGGEREERRQRFQRIYMVSTTIALTLCIVLMAFLFGFGKNTVSASELTDFLFGWLGSETQGEDRDEQEPDVLDGILLPEETSSATSPGQQESDTESTSGEAGTVPNRELLYQFDYSKVPEGEIPIIPMDLSLVSYGASYIYNSTGLTPDTESLLKDPLPKQNQTELLSSKNEPLVLIVHTHGTEAYSEDGAISYPDDGRELARSQDPSETVVSVGALMAEILNRRGISTVHCTVMHDRTQYKDSYLRSEETIRSYLAQYPSIRLVIDVHRDSIVKSTGELVRPVTLVDGKPAAQVMCVVGSNWNGEENPNWEGNLALALKLRQSLNEQYENLCRPPYLKSSTYNQELAPYSLLLEVGGSGNSLAEAKRSAEAVAEALVPLIKELK